MSGSERAVSSPPCVAVMGVVEERVDLVRAGRRGGEAAGVRQHRALVSRRDAQQSGRRPQDLPPQGLCRKGFSFRLLNSPLQPPEKTCLLKALRRIAQKGLKNS